MINKRVATILVLFLISNFVDAVNYCSICNSHIACNNKGDFGSRCPAEKKLIYMTPALKSFILNAHNTKRNILAEGKLQGFKAASRMPTMVWDDELANLATLNVKRCTFEHDKCHNTVKYKYSGQNIAKKWWSGGRMSYLAIIGSQIDSWWNEHKDTTMQNIDSYPLRTLKTIGHFTVMAADKNVALGCAAIEFRDKNMNNWNSLTFVCNYASTNIINGKVYVSGKTASKCLSKNNLEYPGLCSPNEQINPNEL